MTRRPYQKRQYVVSCDVCHTWCNVATLELQRICMEAKACPGCIKDEGWLLRVKIEAITIHLEQIVKRGKALPPDKRDTLRGIYQRKQQQLAQARAQLDALAAVPV